MPIANLIAQLLVSFGLLAYAWYFRDIDKSIASLVVGAVIANWLRESSAMGRQATVASEARKIEAQTGASEEARKVANGHGA